MQDGMAAKVFGKLLGTDPRTRSGMMDVGMNRTVAYKCLKCGDIFDEIEGAPAQCPTCGENTAYITVEPRE